MQNRIFISYSSQDYQTAQKVCNILEKKDIECWIAPRNIRAGKHWGEVIAEAIKSVDIVLLLISSASNNSEQVLREVVLSENYRKIIIPLFIENVKPSLALEYHISTHHWFCLTEDCFDSVICKLMEDIGLIIAEKKEQQTQKLISQNFAVSESKKALDYLKATPKAVGSFMQNEINIIGKKVKGTENNRTSIYKIFTGSGRHLIYASAAAVIFVLIIITVFFVKNNLRNYSDNQYLKTDLSKIENNENEWMEIVYGKYPFVSLNFLKYQDLEGYNKDELTLMRNEILARRGYNFRNDENTKNYFLKQKWYKPEYDDVLNHLSGLDKHNLNIIGEVLKRLMQD